MLGRGWPQKKVAGIPKASGPKKGHILEGIGARAAPKAGGLKKGHILEGIGTRAAPKAGGSKISSHFGS